MASLPWSPAPPPATAARRPGAGATQLHDEGRSVHESAFDVTDGAAAEGAVARIEAEVGAIEILVNNAGVQRRGVFHEFKPDDWQGGGGTTADTGVPVGPGGGQ